MGDELKGKHGVMAIMASWRAGLPPTLNLWEREGGGEGEGGKASEVERGER